MRHGVERIHKFINALNAVIADIACYLTGFCITHSLTHSLDFCSRRGDLRAEEAAVLLQAVLLAAVDRRCGKVISVQSLTLSDRLFRCLPRLCPPWTAPCVVVLETVACLTTYVAKPRQLSSCQGSLWELWLSCSVEVSGRNS